MKHTFYQVDAFTQQLFKGNPAAIVPLKEWLPEAKMQAIAAENNLVETAFFVAQADGFHLRWFTPVAEVELCGHATLATAWVLYYYLDYPGNVMNFYTLGGHLKVVKLDNGQLSMDFPADSVVPNAASEELINSLGIKPTNIAKGRNWVFELSSEKEVAATTPNFDRLAELCDCGVNVTSKGDDCDFVSRFFAPAIGINEDPVTGSAHCGLVSYWSTKLSQTKFFARQISPRGGELHCELVDGRVHMRGRCAVYSCGEFWSDL